jgi:hypothetical protein
MAQQIINTGANANDGTGEPLREAFTAVNDNFTEIYTAGPVGSNVRIVGNTITTLQINQNLTLKPNGIGLIQANATVVPSVNLVYDLGSTTKQWDSVYAGYFIGNGALLTGVAGGNASNSFATISANGVAIVANSATGVLTLTPGNNITIAGSAGTDTVTFGVSSSPVFSGNISAANFLTGGTVSAAGNVTGANLRATGSISTAGNVTANNVVFSGNLVGNISTTGNVIAGNVIATQSIIAASDITSAANITGNYIFGNGAFLTGISGGAGNYSNANVSAFLPTYTGNVSAAYFIGNGSQLTSVTGANVTGIVPRANIANVAYSVSAANVVGNIANATYAEFANLAYNAYGNGVIGSVSSANTANTANIANVAYSVSGANVVGTVANATFAVSAGSAGSANTANTANIANVAYSVAGANVTGTVANATNAEYANLAYYAFGNGIVGQISTTSNIIGGNISTAGNVAGNYFIGNGSQLTGVVATDIGVLASLSVTGNAQIGNVRTAGQVSATGNVTTGNYFVGNGAFITGIVASAGSELLNGFSNVRIGGANANVTVSVNAVSNVAVFTTGGMSTTGNIIANANVLANGQISALGNVTGNYIFGNGALLTGVITSVANINNGTSNVTVVSSGGNITVGVNGSGNVVVFANTGAYVAGVVSASGNVTANYFIGNGSQLTGIDSTTIQNGNSNVKVYANGNVSTSISGTSNVITVSNTGQYVTGVISATGNITGGNLSAVNLVINNIASDDSSYVTIEDGLTVVGEISAAGNVTGSNVNTNNIVGTGLTITSTGLLNLAPTGNITVNAKNINNLADPVQDQDAATKSYVDSQAGNVSGNVIGNLIPLGTPSDSSLTTNVAYPGWTTATYVTDGLDDLNQVALNIAKNTFVGQASLSGTPLAGPSPTTVAFTGSYIGNVNSHLWNFGDGTTSSSANPSKTYSNVSGGQFTVTYTAFNSNGTFGGNAANGAKGSVSSFTATNYITLYTPTPVSAFTVANSSIDTGSSAQISNTSQYANYFELYWGDGSANVNFANGWTTQSHVYTNSANTDSRYGIVLTATSNTAGPANVSTVSSTSFVKVYSPQSPAFTANTLSVINFAATSGGVVSFRNDTPGSPGTTAVYGSQQLYNWQWGDSTANSNINIQSGLAGNPGAANVTHTFALSAGQQTAGTTVNYTANLWLYTGYSTSPFKASNVTITVEPEVRANFSGTANTQSDASGATAQTGYIYTDYNGNNRAVFSFQNTSQLANVYNWSFGDSTFANGISNTANVNKTYTSTGSYTVALTANGTPGVTAQSNTQTRTNYITIAANPAAPGALSTKTISMSTASEGTSPLLAAGATDNSGGNIPTAGLSVTRYVTATPVISTTASGANTSTTGTLTALVNNTASGNTPFTVGTSNTGTFTNLVVSQDADAHTVISATYPTGFYKVFSAYVSKSLASLSTGYSDYKLAHSTTGNTNATGFVKDNLTATPTLSNASVTMTQTTAGTYRYISGVPYYNTGSPAISINSLAVSNLTGQTYRSTATPVTVLSGTNYESTSGSIISTQTKTYAQIDGASSMLTGGIPNANVGIASAYTLGNLAISINGSAQAVATLGANIINVNGTSATIQLPTKIQVYSTALTGFDESNIAVAAGLGSVYTDNAIRVSGIGSGNTPAFSNSTNFYTANAWSGAVTMTGTDETVVRWGTLKHFNSADFSTGYLPVGPDLVTGRSGIQYFTFAFRRATMASFDIILTTTTGIAGLWIAAPGTTIDKSGFSSPTPGYPGPTSTLNGWLTGYQQYNGAGVPGNSATGGNPAGTNGCALTGADVIPLNTAISNQRYTMTLGSQNSSNSTGNNILIRIGLSSGQTLTSVAIGLPT